MSFRFFFVQTILRSGTGSTRRGLKHSFLHQASRPFVALALTSVAAVQTRFPCLLSKLYPTIDCKSHALRKRFSTSAPPSGSLPKDSKDDIELPPPPTDCCMGGCARCVWVLYAEELAQLYKDGGRAAEKVLEAIEDPSLKIFLSLELREKFKD